MLMKKIRKTELTRGDDPGSGDLQVEGTDADPPLIFHVAISGKSGAGHSNADRLSGEIRFLLYINT